MEQRTAAPYTVLGWGVPDIARAIRELTGRGVEFERYDGMDQDADGAAASANGSGAGGSKTSQSRRQRRRLRR